MTKVSDTKFPLDSNRVHAIGQGAYPDYSRWEEGQQKTNPAGFSKFVGGIDPISSFEEKSFEKTLFENPVTPFVPIEKHWHEVKIHKGNTNDIPSELKDNPITPNECSLEEMSSKVINRNPLVLNAQICQLIREQNPSLAGLTDFEINDRMGHVDHTAREISDFNPAEIDPKSVNIVSRSILNSNTIICIDDKGYEYREFVNKEGKRVLIQVLTARKDDNEHDSPIDEHLDYAAEKSNLHQEWLEKRRETRAEEPTTIEQLQQGLEFLTRDIEYLKKDSITNFHMQQLRVDLQEVIELHVKNITTHAMDSYSMALDHHARLINELKKELKDVKESVKEVSKVSINHTNKCVKEQIELSERKTAQMTKNGFDNVWLDIEKLQRQRRAWKVNFALGTSIVTLIIIIAYIASQNI